MIPQDMLRDALQATSESALTLRDKFAIAALPGLIIALNAEVSATRTAETAYHMADAMMKVRARGAQS